jgi:hypothetical protein
LAGFLVFSSQVFEVLKRHLDAAAADTGKLPAFRRGTSLWEASQENLQPAAGDLSEGDLPLSRKGFGAPVQVVRELDLGSHHDVIFTSFAPAFQGRPCTRLDGKGRHPQIPEDLTAADPDTRELPAFLRGAGLGKAGQKALSITTGDLSQKIRYLDIGQNRSKILGCRQVDLVQGNHARPPAPLSQWLPDLGQRSDAHHHRNDA